MRWMSHKTDIDMAMKINRTFQMNIIVMWLKIFVRYDCEIERWVCLWHDNKDIFCAITATTINLLPTPACILAKYAVTI